MGRGSGCINFKIIELESTSDRGFVIGSPMKEEVGKMSKRKTRNIQ